MSVPFLRWRAALDAAVDDASRRSLLGEIGRWRAAHLIDVVGQREAAFALVNLYEALGDKEAALREARSLASLCRTPPYAERQETDIAEDLVARLSGKPRRKAPSGRDARGGGPRRPQDPLEQAVELGYKGDIGGAFKALRGKGGPRANLIRTWLDLTAALDGPAEAREEALRALQGKLEKNLPGGRHREQAHKAKTPAAPAEPKPLVTRVDKVVGRAVPDRREKRLRLLARALELEPEKADALAAALLLDHLDAAGPGAGAPWLVRFVGRADTVDGAETKAAIEALRAAGAVAVQAYDERPYAVIVGLWKRAAEAGLELRDLRRGVLRTEPEDRRIWTTRLGSPGNEAMLAIAPVAAAAYAEGVAGTLAARIAELSEHALLLAPGDGNASLREAALAAGVILVDADADLLAAVTERQGPVAPPRGRKASTPSPAPARADTPAEPTHRERVEAVRVALFADEAPTAESLEALVAPVRKVRDVLDLADALASDDAEQRLVALLTAVHRTAPPEVRLLQGTTLALRAAGANGGSGAAADLLTTGEVAERLGGSGMNVLLPTAAAAQQAGWTLLRVLRGATRRERRAQPALDVLGAHLDGLWRLVVQQGEARGEIWVAEELSPEGRAAVPQLTLEERARVAVLPAGSPLLDAWEGLGGPTAIAWDETGADALGAALGAWGG